MTIILIFICLLSIIFSIYCYYHRKKINDDINDLNKIIENENKNLLLEKKELNIEINKLNEEINILSERKNNTQISLDSLLNNLSKTTKTQENLSKRAFENYCELLDKDYETKEKEYDDLLNNLDNIYRNKQEEYAREFDLQTAELDKIRATRAAALEAINREEQIKLNSLFYCLQIPEEDLRESKIIKDIEKLLRDPRPVRMLIWSTYYIKRANELCSRVLGNETITGIYKITNLRTGLSYIGQAVDIKSRWRDHMKAGLGIDAPAGHKLYSAMMQDGIENFTFELLEECKSEELDEKEKTYITLYDTYNFGYNQNKGNGKGLI